MSIWQRERVPGVPGRHALGLWLTYRKVASAAYVPGAVSRYPLRYKVRLDYPLTFSLAARLNSESRIVSTEDFWLTDLMGSSIDPATGLPIAAGFRLQIYDSIAKQRLSDPINFANYLGSARRPHILRKPYRFCANAPILVRVQNQDTSAVTNQIQLVLGGYGT